MFDFVRQHSRLMFLILVLLIIPSFVFFGMEGYTGMRDKANTSVAEVSGISITQAEWDAAHRDQSQRIMNQMPNVDAKLLDSAEMRGRVLDGLIRDRVLGVAATKLHLEVTDSRLKRLFSTDPEFASLRNADGTVNKDILAMQGMNSEIFAQRLRQDISKRQVLQTLQDSVPSTVVPADTALNAFFQQREIQVLTIEAKDFAGKVNPSDADLEGYYKSPTHAAEFKAAEKADIEYVMLDLDTLMKSVVLGADEATKFYKENQARYSTPQERRASHILLKVDAKSSKDEAEKVRVRAQGLLDQIKKDPKAFADLAKKNSDDPGSAANGGDLDFFGRAAMVKPFEEAAYALKVGEVSELVRSDFGFHIIQLTGIRGGEVRSFESVKAEIEDELRRQAARKKYADLASELTNAVYEQADSLQPVVEKFKLELRKVSGAGRTASPGAQGPMGSAKFLDALFSADSVSSKRNTDAIEIAPNQLVSGRIVTYSPARVLPLSEVKEQVRARVVQEQAQALARKEGEARLATFKADKAAALDAPALMVSRVQSKDLPKVVLDAALGAAPNQLPAWLGVNVPGRGYAVVRVNKVVGRDPIAADLTQGRQQYAQAWADAESQAYFAALKNRLKVKVIAPAAQTALDSAASAAR